VAIQSTSFKPIKEYNVKLIASMIGVGLIGGSALAKEVTAEMKLPGMDCDACTVVIRRALTQTKGVKTVDLNVDKRTATVVYDDTLVTEPQIQKAIEKTGFKAEPARRPNHE
jgi:mercuric ion binding protein